MNHFFSATPWRDALGGLVIQAIVKKPSGRLGFEDQFFRGVEVGLAGWERCHSQGNIVGAESPYGIRYAPQEVNQQYQRLGIERYLHDFLQVKAPDVELLLTTVTYTHPGTLRLREIQYKLESRRNGMNLPMALFEASIMIANKSKFPRVDVDANFRLHPSDWAQACF